MQTVKLNHTHVQISSNVALNLGVHDVARLVFAEMRTYRPTNLQNNTFKEYISGLYSKLTCMGKDIQENRSVKNFIRNYLQIINRQV